MRHDSPLVVLPPRIVPMATEDVGPMTAYVDHYAGERRQNWRTPRAMFDALQAEYGFDMDGAADADSGLLLRRSTVDAPESWIGRRVFCNPPWSEILPFVELAATAELAVLLVPARVNARWFHRALDLGAVPRYFVGKPRFDGAKWKSPVDCLLLVFQA